MDTLNPETQRKNLAIKDQFLNESKLTQLVDKSKRGNIIYDNYCQCLENYYLGYKTIFDYMYQFIKIKPHQKNVGVKEFKCFINEWNTLLKDISIYQIDCLTQIRALNEDTLSQNLESFINIINLAKVPQNNFGQKLKTSSQIIQKIKETLERLQKQMKQPIIFYNQKIMQVQKKQFQQLINKLNQIYQQMNKQIDKIGENSIIFEKQLTLFRKKLFNNKYSCYEKLVKMSARSKECFIELTILLFKNVIIRHEKFKAVIMTQSVQRIKMKKIKYNDFERNDYISTQVILMSTQYIMTIDELIEIVNQIVKCLQIMLQKQKKQYEKCKINILQTLNKLYEMEQNPSKILMESLELFDYFSKKMYEMTNKLINSTEQLNKLRQNVKKHTDITLSLMKIKNYEKIAISPTAQTAYYPIDQLNEQMSYDFINDIINKVYLSYQQTIVDMKNYLNSNFYKKKKNQIQDSMEVSYLNEKTTLYIKKRPFKDELWLWGDPKQHSYKFNYPKELISEVTTLLKEIITQKEHGKEISKYNCILANRKNHKGILKVYKKQLSFQSSDNLIHLIIPFNHIQKVQQVVKTFEKQILINTSYGILTFGKFNNNIQDIVKQLQKMINEEEQVKISKPKRVKIILENQQINFIKKRKESLKLQADNQLLDIGQKYFEDITIEQIYDLLYSDKPTTVRGKTYPNFFGYFYLKLDNFNLTATPYKQPGPKYYTLNPQVTFLNCPLFSQRVIQFDHPIPKIPFLPKHCHNREISKIYWISHEQFDYVIESQSSGAPYSQNFYYKGLHKIRKFQNGVKIKSKGAIVFRVQFAMKGFIKSKGQAEMIQGGKIFLNEAQKYIKSQNHQKNVKNNVDTDDERKNETTQQIEIKSNIKNNHNHQMNKIKLQNKILVYSLAIIIIINILLKIFLK